MVILWNLYLHPFERKTRISSSNWTKFLTKLILQFSSLSVVLVPSSNQLFAGNLDVSCLNLMSLWLLSTGKTHPILLSKRYVAHAPPTTGKQNKLNAQNTFREVADQSEGNIIDEPISRPPNQTVIQRSIGRKEKDRKQSKMSRLTIAVQLVASSTATRYSLDQAIDSTDDKLEPAQSHIPDVQLAAHPVNWEKKPSLTAAQAEQAKPAAKSTLSVKPGTSLSAERTEPVNQRVSLCRRNALNLYGLGVMISTLHPLQPKRKSRLRRNY